MIKLPRKKRTRSHVIADLSANHTERQALLCGYTVERNRHDYGIDLEITTFNYKGEIDEGKILIQLKASERLKVRSDGSIPCRVDRKDLVYWRAHPMPVILIVYDAARNIAYWLYVQSYVRKLAGFSLFTAGKTVTMAIPPSNVVSPDAMIKFARFRDRMLRQIGKVVHDEDENQDDSI
jgi:hypothetical protein